MSRMNFDTTKGKAKRIHADIVNANLALSEKAKETQSAISMFHHKAYTADMKRAGGTVR